MKTKTIIYILALIVIASCVKMPKRVDTELPISPLGAIPYDFDWRTIKTIDLTLNVTSAGIAYNNGVHVLKIYNSPLLDRKSTRLNSSH